MGIFSNFRETFESIKEFRKLLANTASIDPESDNLITDDFERSIDKHRHNAFCRFEGEIWSYDDLETYANRVAHWAQAEGIGRGDTVALISENCAEYVGIWFGLSKIGAITALINHNLQGKALVHCVDVAEAKAVIAGKENIECLDEVREDLSGSPAIWGLNGEPVSGNNLETVLPAMSSERPSREMRAGIKASATVLNVYTSGTTGLPKAARLSHTRVQWMTRTFVTPTKASARDRVYVTLPLYHSTGGLCGVGVAVNSGACMILRRKFSATQFWQEATEQGATIIVYIGELCRYLLNAPPSEYDTKHSVRTGFGNGLRPDIWQAFLDRFEVDKLVEFYGSTEGNVSFLNVNGKVGAVGHIPKILEHKMSHVRFVKFDIETEMPVRGEDGFCIEAEPGEAAEVIGQLGDESVAKFDGYKDEEATKKKILTNVFAEGDQWFRTGDLLKKDEQGYVYFVDRIGDTFRWKGENVSTNEVSEVLATHESVALANVYGVSIPGMDGKAGMAALTLQGELDFDTLRDWLGEKLPAYALPIFLRVQTDAETTGTMKYRKVDLVKDGFNPARVSDPIWFYHPDAKQYRPLTHDDYDTILAGGYRF